MLAVMLAAGLALTGCSSDADQTDNAQAPSPPTASEPFAGSDVVHERFGSLTARDLSPTSSDTAKAAVVDSFNAFTLDVHRALAAAEPGSNAIASGYSLASALALTAAGTGGESRAALNSLLRLDALPTEQIDAAINAVDLDLASRANDDLQLRSANRLFIRAGEALQPSYLDNATGNFGAPITEADFKKHAPQVVEAINQWVSEQTNGLIDQLLQEIDPDTLVAVLNAIVLDATWQDTYTDTGNSSFSTLDGRNVSTPFFAFDGSLPVLQEDGMTVVEMPYSGGAIAMLLIMPDDLATFEQSLNPTELDRITGALQSRLVDYTLPEWTFQQEIDAKALLEPLGLPTGALDFSNMLVTDPGNLEISAVKQKARIEVDRNGTRAAAATVVVIAPTSAPIQEDPLQITIDKPFWYAIRDRVTGTVLFSGRVVDPTV
jgi:serpin B